MSYYGAVPAWKHLYLWAVKDFFSDSLCLSTHRPSDKSSQFYETFRTRVSWNGLNPTFAVLLDCQLCDQHNALTLRFRYKTGPSRWHQLWPLEALNCPSWVRIGLTDMCKQPDVEFVNWGFWGLGVSNASITYSGKIIQYAYSEIPFVCTNFAQCGIC
jgi:hypothetical protein